jgi:ubiquinone/menaquinone biosynthesis C-methylase UbiE
MSSERLLHKNYNGWTGEHLHRYQEVVNFIKPNDTVLDIACGTGYGTHLISTKTKGKVIGGDIDREAIEDCKNEWGGLNIPNLVFQQLDGTALPFENESLDMVVSFETIEHTTQYNEMIGEFVRVLKKGSYALISTPNILINSPSGVVENKFHTQEFTYEELNAILKQHFTTYTIYGQEYIRYKSKTGLNYTIAKNVENVLLMRGVRKIPMGIQDALMTSLVDRILYPQANDYVLNDDIAVIKKCRTLFAVCLK